MARRKWPGHGSNSAIQPLPPAKERIMTAARELFSRHGIGVSLYTIAEAAETNIETIVKYYRSWQGLVMEFLRDEEDVIELEWKQMEQEHPGDPRGQLQTWLEAQEANAVLGDWSGFDLLRAAAFVRPYKHPRVLAYIRQLKLKERNMLADKCKAAGFSDPKGIADKLMLIVNGAMTGNLIYGENGPGVELIKTAELLMAAHQTAVSKV